MKVLYIHIPKTAGSSLNKYFSENLHKFHFHIESTKNLSSEFCEQYEFLSGHVTYNRMNTMLRLNEWTTLATFREPISYVVSHLKWVRKLADVGEEERLKQHPEIFQRIALKMTQYDFSIPADITQFIHWLESINVFYFHSTQMHYMHATKEQGRLNKKQIQFALNNISKIDFIGLQENMDDFMKNLSYEFGWQVDTFPRENINLENYGFDLNCEETKKALYPLYKDDLLLYQEAQKKYKKQQYLYDTEPIEHIIGFVDGMTPHRIQGWALSKSSLQKVELELMLNNKCVQTTVANLFRQGLKSKGLHPTGNCAFRFLLNGNIDYGKCKVRVKNSSVYLPIAINCIKKRR